jgi:saccharopine dehydrogenase-like NADP-dependent oxidoreductase
MKNKQNINYDRHNYRSMVLAGLGSVGQGVLALAEPHLIGFDKIVLADNDLVRCQNIKSACGWPIIHGDIENPSFITGLLSSLPCPVLFVNLCLDIDTVKLRTILAPHMVGYIDICESRMDENTDSRFSVGMPYTNQSCHGKWPHLVCQGINPGMVEYIARSIIEKMGSEQSDYSATIYENDQLAPAGPEDIPLVAWSPQDLVDEVVIAPAMQFDNQRCIESSRAGGQLVNVLWQGQPFEAWQIGHEDVWNLGQLQNVSDVRFFYTLSPTVMDFLKTLPEQAARNLRLPTNKERICGTERIVVSVKQNVTGFQRNVLWETDHARMQKMYGINAVQFQTAASTLLSVLLMQHTDIGCRWGTFNASTLPLDSGGWAIFREIMGCLDIRWQPIPKDYVSSKVSKWDQEVQSLQSRSV